MEKRKGSVMAAAVLALALAACGPTDRELALETERRALFEERDRLRAEILRLKTQASEREAKLRNESSQALETLRDELRAERHRGEQLRVELLGVQQRSLGSAVPRLPVAEPRRSGR